MEEGVDGSEDGVDGEVFGDGNLATLREGVGGKANELGLGRFRALTRLETGVGPTQDGLGVNISGLGMDDGVAHVGEDAAAVDDDDGNVGRGRGAENNEELFTISDFTSIVIYFS